MHRARRAGTAIGALDAPFARRGGSPVRFTEADRAEQAQLVTGPQRAVDLLVAWPDVDASRLACIGFSYGGGTATRRARFLFCAGIMIGPAPEKIGRVWKSTR